MRTKLTNAVLVLLAGVCLSGCNPTMNALGVFNSHFEAGDFKQAGQFAENKIKKGSSPSGDDLLWALQLAASQRNQLDHAGSIATFDKAEEMLNYYVTNLEALDTASSIVINDNAVPL